MMELNREEILRLIASGRPLGEVLERICLLVEAQLQGCLCSIHVLAEDGQTIRLEAAPSLPAEMREEIADPDTRRSCRPIEVYATGGALAFAEDVENHPHWAGFHSGRSTAARLRSCWSLPVSDRTGQPVAVIFGIYRERASISEDSISTVASLAYFAALAIERDRRDAALLASDRRSKFLDMVSPTGKFQGEWSGTRTAVNRRWQEITGLTEEQATGDGWLANVHSEDLDRVRSEWRKAVDTKSGFSCEYRLVRPGRPVVWIYAQTTPAGEHGYFGTILDITAQKVAEAAFREGEERFRTLANNISQLAWMADEKGWVFWYNQRWYDYTGTAFDDMKGWGWRKVHHPDYVESVVGQVERAWAVGEEWELTFPLRSADGEYRWFLTRAVPIKDPSGQVVRWFGTNTDVTKLRDLEAALHRQNQTLRRSNEDLSLFAYVASHDLQEPLRTISNYTQLIQRTYGHMLDETGKTFMEHVVSASKRLSSLITDLDVYSRATKEDRPYQRVALSQLADRVFADCRQMIEETGATVTTGPLPKVNGEESHLALVLQNLIANSIKYRRKDVRPKIRIDSERTGSHYTIRVHDNGEGFSQEYADLIFGLFKRLHGNELPGTGIGLAICKSIVERHGGRIGAEGRPGQGATFWFTLPVP